jgi:hypothetical protein
MAAFQLVFMKRQLEFSFSLSAYVFCLWRDRRKVKEETLPRVYAIFFFLFFFVALDGGTLWHLQMFLQHIKYIIYLNSTPPPFSFIFHSWNNFNRYHFSIYMHVYTAFGLYSPSHALSPPLLLRIGTSHPRQYLFHATVLWFCKRKKNDSFACLR